MGFNEEMLKAPVVVSHTSDKARPTVLRIDGERKELRVEFTKGSGEGGDYNPRFTDNVTVANTPDTKDEDGNPVEQPKEWDDFIAGNQLAAWCRAQPSAVSNGAVLQKLASYILTQKGVI